MRGFSLIELMIALLVLSSGILAVGQMLFVAASSASLSRSTGSAAIAAQDRIESLASLYHRDPFARELMPGSHGPQQIEIVNPDGGTTLNRFRVLWNVEQVPDPRPGKTLDARLLQVIVEPVSSEGSPNNKPGLNKTVNVSTILSPKTPWYRKAVGK